MARVGILRPHLRLHCSILLLTGLLSATALLRVCAAQPSHVSDYMGYVTKCLPTASGHRRNVLLAIQDMYVDLEAQRKPQVRGNATLYPIGFSIPEEHVARSPPPKTSFVSMPYWARSTGEVKEHYSTTASSDGEALYYRAMSRSFFSLTVRKSGNDCMRHLEVSRSV